MLEIGQPAIERPYAPGKTLQMAGIHCEFGGNGKEFTWCTWTGSRGGHGPIMVNCEFADDEHWDIRRTTGCGFTTVWGPHTGAGPGGECAMAGVILDDNTLATPHGLFNALAVANSGQSVCLKAAPPLVRCEVGPLNPLKHGNVGPGGENDTEQSTAINCGSNPKIDILGGGDVELGPGLRAELRASLATTTRLRVTSRLRAAGAQPGFYSGSVVIAVSPN